MSCFKKGCECRFSFPSAPSMHHSILFDETKPVSFYDFSDFSETRSPFLVLPKRRIGDLFLNTHSHIATSVFSCNTNVQIGDYGHMYYVTLYVNKGNQKEETKAHLNTTNALSRRLHRQIANKNVSDEATPDFVEGLSRVLSGIRAHMLSSIISPPLAHLLVCQDSRFSFSHEFSHLLVSQIEDYLDGNTINFKPRNRKSKDGKKTYWPDSTVYDIIYRPETLEDVCAYDLMMKYERGYYNGKKTLLTIPSCHLQTITQAVRLST